MKLVYVKKTSIFRGSVQPALSKTSFATKAPTNKPFNTYQRTTKRDNVSSSPLLETTSLISKQPTQATTKAIAPEEKKEPWNPTKKLVRSEMNKLRELHQQDPNTNTISHLSNTFKIPKESVKRILRSSWSPPTEVNVRQDVKKMIERKFAASHGAIPYRIKEQLDLLSQVSKIWENNPKDHEATIHMYQISKEITNLTKSLLPSKVLGSLGLTTGTSTDTTKGS